MKNLKIKRTCLLLIHVLVLSAVPAFSNPGKERGGGVPLLKPPKQIFIGCPASVKYLLQTPSGWDAGLTGQVTLLFKESAIDGKYLYCRYEVNNNVYKNHVTLMQALPKGYGCRNDGEKSKFFTCEQILPQGRKKN